MDITMLVEIFLALTLWSALCTASSYALQRYRGWKEIHARRREILRRGRYDSVTNPSGVVMWRSYVPD